MKNLLIAILIGFVIIQGFLYLTRSPKGIIEFSNQKTGTAPVQGFQLDDIGVGEERFFCYSAATYGQWNLVDKDQIYLWGGIDPQSDTMFVFNSQAGPYHVIIKKATLVEKTAGWFLGDLFN